MASASASASVAGGGLEGGDGSSSSSLPGVAIGPRSVEEAMWQLTLGGGESMESGPYPERIGEPDCSYYMRTGLCKFGMTCKFNHPSNMKLVASNCTISLLYCSLLCFQRRETAGNLVHQNM